MRAYQSSPGDSFTFGGNSFTADESGLIAVDDSVPHEELISHGFAPAADKPEVVEVSGDEQPAAKRRGRKPAQE